MNERNQLNFIYNNIDIEVRVNNLRRSRNIIIINDYLKKLNEFKYDWWVKKNKIMRISDNVDNQNNQRKNYRNDNARSSSSK